MFQYLYEWMANAAFYLVIFTAVLQLLPNETYQKYVRFFTGLIMILLILTPVLKVLGMERTFLDFYEVYQNEVSRTEVLEESDGDEVIEEGRIYVEKIQIGGEIAQ